ncbi:MAG TPA: ABC transporter permease [Bacteroidota bacterium]|nr:ABC transporter permease [Bacteroidota bacterium]
MSKTFEVAKWEYIEKVRSRAFIASLFITPVIMLVAGALPSLLANRPDTESKVIGIVDQTGQLAVPLRDLLNSQFKLPDNQPNYVLRDISASPGYEKTADSLAIAQELEGYLVIPTTVMTDTNVVYRSENVGNIKLVERLTKAVNDIIVGRKLRIRNIDTAAIRDLTTHLELKTIKLSKTGKAEESGFDKLFIPSYIFMMMMFFVLLTSGQMLVRSLLEEKANRVIEVLVSSCTPSDLMMGKILGLSGVGITQLLLWIAIGLGLFPAVVMGLMSTSMLILPVYFILGYLFFAAVFVAIGSSVSTEQEAQLATSYLMILLIVPIGLSFMVVSDPNSTLVRVLTFIPFLTATMMAMRVPVQMPAMWEIAGTIVVLALSAAGMMWAAGRIFRVAMLVYGKRPSIGELIRIVKSK